MLSGGDDQLCTSQSRASPQSRSICVDLTFDQRARGEYPTDHETYTHSRNLVNSPTASLTICRVR
jgi:hypothetical protein